MAVSATYIGVVILLVILIGFVLTVIRTLAKSAGKQIRQDMKNLLTSYDDLINEKLVRYKEIQEKAKSQKQNILEIKQFTNESNLTTARKETLSASSFIKKEVKHRDSALADGYDSIKSVFRDFKNEVSSNKDLIATYNKRTAYDESLLKILDGLSIDNVYEIGSESSEDQLKFFTELLEDKDKVVLDKFLSATHGKKFSTIQFYDWLKTCSKEIPTIVEVRTGNIDDNKSTFEPSICEGYQIVTGEKLYDYSISKRDIQ